MDGVHPSLWYEKGREEAAGWLSLEELEALWSIEKIMRVMMLPLVGCLI